MSYHCLLCDGNILDPMGLPSIAGAAWICCICDDGGFDLENLHYADEESNEVIIDVSLSSELDSDEEFCSVCGIVLNPCCGREHCICCRCFEDQFVTEESARKDSSSSDEEEGTSTECPQDDDDLESWDSYSDFIPDDYPDESLASSDDDEGDEDVPGESQFEFDILDADDAALLQQQQDSEESIPEDSKPYFENHGPAMKRSRH
jgi:hypothetical protein